MGRPPLHLPRRRALDPAPDPDRRPLHRSPAGHGLVADALVRDRRRRHRLPLGPADRAQPPPQGDGPLRRGRSARRGLRHHDGTAPRQARGVGRPVPALALPEARHVVAGAPVLAVGGADHEPDAHHRQGPRRPQQLAGRHRARTRVAIEGPYGAFTHHARHTDRVVLVAAGVGVTPVRALLEDLPRHVDVVAILRGRQPARPGPARRARPPGRASAAGSSTSSSGRARTPASTRPASPSSCPTSPTGTCTSAAPAASCRASSPPPAAWASAASASTTRTSPSRRPRPDPTTGGDMKRSAIVIAATAAGLAAVISFKPHGIAGGGTTGGVHRRPHHRQRQRHRRPDGRRQRPVARRQPRRHPGQGHRRRTARSPASAWPG